MRSSPSRIEGLFNDPAFLLAWDNAPAFHVATNVLHLRKFRGLSQAQVAKRMATSQPKVARIEGGDDNITLRTLRKIAEALKGRICLQIEPAEVGLPKLPPWWEAIEVYGTAASFKSWDMRVYATVYDGGVRKAAAGWMCSEVAIPEQVMGDAVSVGDGPLVIETT